MHQGHLSMTEREIIAQCRAQGLSQAAMARRLWRHSATDGVFDMDNPSQ